MRLPSRRSLAVSLALAAMVLRALLPDGWMPAAGASPFVICSVDGAKHDGKGPAQPGRERSHAPCAFAAAAPLSPPAAIASVPGASGKAARLAVTFTDDVFVRAIAHRANAARAPPSFS